MRIKEKIGCNYIKDKKRTKKQTKDKGNRQYKGKKQKQTAEYQGSCLHDKTKGNLH